MLMQPEPPLPDRNYSEHLSWLAKVVINVAARNSCLSVPGGNELLRVFRDSNTEISVFRNAFTVTRVLQRHKGNPVLTACHDGETRGENMEVRRGSS